MLKERLDYCSSQSFLRFTTCYYVHFISLITKIYRYHKPDFYVMDIDDDDDVSKLEIKKVNELRKLNESYIQVFNTFKL